jgi:hypothetical protein
VFISILVALRLTTNLAIPAVVIWGWFRWLKSPGPRTIPSTFSLISFSLASASVLLAFATHLYAAFVRSFPYYDPTLMRIYAWGGFLSLAAVIFAIGGLWRQSPLRWHAPACALGTLLFWLMAMSSE